MKKAAAKTWTVLVYAAGQNELSPEIYRTFTELESNGVPNKAVVVIQLARASGSLLSCLRPTASCDRDCWSGVKRFLIQEEAAEELADLGNVDMSQPDVLAEFLRWGLTSFPAERVMVILSGHGAGFIGLMSDFARRHRSLMSLKGLAAALANGMAAVRKDIDVLVMDACFTHMVEVWYELALLPAGRIRFLITPLGNLRLEGMAVQPLIKAVAEGSRRPEGLKTALVKAVQSVNVAADRYGEVMIVALNRQLLQRLKHLIGMAAVHIRRDDGRLNTGPTLALADLFAAPALAPLRAVASQVINGLYFVPGIKVAIGQNLGPSILSPAARREYLSFQPYYDILQFARENRWTRLLQGKQFPVPVAVPLESVVATMVSLNSGLSREQAWNRLRQAGWFNLPAYTSGIEPPNLPARLEEVPQMCSDSPTRGLLLGSRGGSTGAGLQGAYTPGEFTRIY